MLDSVAVGTMCISDYSEMNGIIGEDTKALIIDTASSENELDNYGYFILEMNEIPLDTHGYYLYNLFVALSESDSITGDLYRMEQPDSHLLPVGSYTASLIDHYPSTFPWRFGIQGKQSCPIQEVPAIICISDSFVSVCAYFNEPISIENSLLEFRSILDSANVFLPASTTWFSIEDSLNTVWCCSLVYGLNSVESGEFILECHLKDLEGAEFLMNADFYPRLTINNRPSGQTMIVDLRFAAEVLERKNWSILRLFRIE